MRDASNSPSISEQPSYLALRAQNAAFLAVSLPFELLGEIFVRACLQTRPIGRYPPLPMWDRGDVSRTIRSSLAATCHSWREVVIGTSSLWSRIHIEINNKFNYNSPCKIAPSLHMISLETQRSSQRLLHLQIRCFLHVPELWDNIHKFLDRRQILQRCETVDFVDCTNFTAMPSWLPNLETSGPLSQLHGLTLHFNQLGREFPLPPSPNLENLSLFQTTNISYHSHLTNLVRLKLWSVSPLSVVLGVLQTNPRLETLCLLLHEEWPAALKLPHSIDFPRLRHFWFGALSSASTRLFSVINAPSLAFLDIRYVKPHLRTNQFPKLQHLQLGGEFGEDSAPLDHILVNTPTIIQLHVWAHRAIFELARLLGKRDKDEGFEVSPMLEALECALVGADDFVEVDQLLKSRNDGMTDGPGVKFVMFESLGNPHANEDFRVQHQWSYIYLQREDPFDPSNWELSRSS